MGLIFFGYYNRWSLSQDYRDNKKSKYITMLSDDVFTYIILANADNHFFKLVRCNGSAPQCSHPCSC